MSDMLSDMRGREIADWSLDKLASFIANYMNRDDGNAEDAARILHAFAKLKDDAAREYVAAALAAFFCRECGSDTLPCYCTRDD